MSIRMMMAHVYQVFMYIHMYVPFIYFQMYICKYHEFISIIYINMHKKYDCTNVLCWYPIRSTKVGLLVSSQVFDGTYRLYLLLGLDD